MQTLKITKLYNDSEASMFHCRFADDFAVRELHEVGNDSMLPSLIWTRYLRFSRPVFSLSSSNLELKNLRIQQFKKID